MYDDLVEALRLCVKYGKGADVLANALKAADAIEELQAQNNELLFRCGQAEALIDYYQAGKLRSNEPPKEEE